MINLLSILSIGIPISYNMGKDSWIISLLFICFFITSFALYRSKLFLIQLAKDYMLTKERGSIFLTTTPSEIRYLIVLIIQTCLLMSIIGLDIMIDWYHKPLGDWTGMTWVFFLFSVIVAYQCVKWGIYRLFGWIFFPDIRTSIWLESYATLLYYLGFILFPLALLFVTFNLSPFIALSSIIFIFIIFKLLILLKWNKLFCSNFYGSLLIFLYFCALEIIPPLLLLRGVVEFTDYLTVKI